MINYKGEIIPSSFEEIYYDAIHSNHFNNTSDESNIQYKTRYHGTVVVPISFSTLNSVISDKNKREDISYKFTKAVCDYIDSKIK